MRSWIALQSLILALAASPLQAGQFLMAMGALTLAEDGVDLQLGYRPDQSHWVYGYRYVRWTDTSRDPFFGRALTKSTTTMSGPSASYLFRPESRGSWYVGASILKVSRTERALLTGEEGRDSTTALFFGGGFMGSFGKSGFYNLGLLLSPGTKLVTRTSVSSEEETGLLDAQAQIGLSF